jgi:GrpB-like predicted nucleotidyltransferase (UPF0157 family)
VDAPIVIENYNPRWPELYEAEKARLLDALGPAVAGIEHMGSTSVPGLGAKPIIDIMLGVRNLDDAQAFIEPLARLGYEYRPEFETSIPDRRFFRRIETNVRTHHLHVVEMGGAFWERHLLFRDYLRTHPETAQAYEALKRDLAARYAHDRDAYTESKTAFIQQIEAQARAERTAQDV